MDDILTSGGPIMVPLLVLSLISWFIFFERFFYIKKKRRQFSELKNKIELRIKKSAVQNLEEELIGVDAILTLPIYNLLESTNEPVEIQNFIVERNLLTLTGRLKSSLWILGTISSVSPFVGLFGTVLGIIKSFKSIAIAGKGGFAVVAADLSEALIATAAGILVAIVSVAFFNYFQNQIKDVVIEFRNGLSEILFLIRKKNETSK